MALDAGIFNQVGQGVRSVQDYDLLAQQQQNAQLVGQQNRLALMLDQQKMAEGQQKAQEANQLRNLLAGATTNEERIRRARASGLPSAYTFADSVEKADLERQKAAADVSYKGAQTRETDAQAQAKQYDLARKRTEHTIQGLSQFGGDPQAMQQWLADSVARGDMEMQQARMMTQSLATAKDPAKWAQDGIFALQEAGKQAGFFRPDANAQLGAQTSVANAKLSADTSRANNAASLAVQMRGQNMTDARSREGNAVALTKPFEVTGPDGLPILVQQDKQGNITPVQGFGPKSGSAKPLTEGQSKALLFGTRAQESDKIIEELASQGVKGPSLAQQMSGGTGITGRIATAVASPKQQQAEQAQRDFINAVLRRESGAVISPGEFDNARLQYFVQPGDSKEVIAQKARNRQLAKDGILAEVPEGRRASITPKPSDSGGPKAGSVEGGYRFKGGDPANKDNWEKV